MNVMLEDMEPKNTPGATLRRMLLLLLAALVVAFGIAARADTVRLYDQVGVENAQVTLAQVAELHGPAAQALADVVLVTLDDGRSERTVTLADVEKAMQDAGVNRGLVSLRGFNACHITRLAEPPAPVLDRGQAVVANIETPIDLDAALTLRTVIEQQLTDMVGVPADELRISFSERDAKRMDVPAVGRAVEVEPIAPNTLGRVPIVIRLYAGHTVADSFTVNAVIRRTLLAVVTTGPVSRGEVLTRAHVQVRECVLDDSAVVAITDPSIVIGQEAASPMRAGEMLVARAVKSPVMVKRGELVDVRCFVGGLIVRTVGKAMENGSLDDRVLVRSESTGDTYYAVVTGRHEAVVSTDAAVNPEATTAMAEQTHKEVTP
jgi:flagella basal body P-ring formation protein FlgA